MDDEQIIERFAILTARVLTLRDITARLLAHEAQRSSDPDKYLQDISDAMDARLYDFAQAAATGTTELSLTMQETTRKDLDWIVLSARQALSE